MVLTRVGPPYPCLRRRRLARPLRNVAHWGTLYCLTFAETIHGGQTVPRALLPHVQLPLRKTLSQPLAHSLLRYSLYPTLHEKLAP